MAFILNHLIKKGEKIMSMDILKKDEFKKIINHEEDEVITLYFLTHEKGMEVNEDKDSLQFKNV